MRKRIIPAVPERIVDEDIISLTVNFNSKSIALIMGEVDADGKVISNRSVNLGLEGYEMVMAGSPDWAKGKPAGEFRRADIFKVMDLLGIE